MGAKFIQPPIFVDRDGTLVEEVHFLSTFDQMRLIAGAAQAIRRANAAGGAVIVISNQSGVARGKFSEEFARQCADHLRKLLAEQGARIDGYYFCPHHPQGAPPYNIECEDRKPRPGMMLRAAAELGVELEGAWMIGDRKSDLQTGAQLGVRPLLVRTGYGMDAEHDLPRDFAARGGKVFDDVAAAITWILGKGMTG